MFTARALLPPARTPGTLQTMPRPKRPFVASLDQVRITRQGDTAIIEYADPLVGDMHFQIGPEIGVLSDQEILDLHNEDLLARQAMADAHEWVAVEVPLGLPQIRYAEAGDQWVPRGGVLRCVIDDGGEDDNQAVIYIDDHELSLREFGRMLTTYAGWGMRIEFCPDDETHERPVLEVREPGPDPEDPR